MFQELIDRVDLQTAGGTNTYTIPSLLGVTSYSGLSLRVRFTNHNTGTSTLNINSLGAKTLKNKATGANLAASDLVDGGTYTVSYDGTNIQVDLGGGGGGGTVTSVTGTTNRITSTGGATPVIDISATFEGLLGKVASPLSQFAATTSSQFAGVISDETGTAGSVVLSVSPTFTGVPIAPTAALGTNTTQIATTAGLMAEIANAALTIPNGIAVGNGSTFSAAVSATDIKTVKGVSLLGSGDLGTITVPYGGSGLTSFTAYGLLVAGTTSTGNFQQVSGTGTSGQALISNGAGVLPTWQAVVGGVSSVFGRTGAVVAVAGDYGPTLGGTGQTTVATGDLLKGSGTNTWGKLAKGTSLQNLRTNTGATDLEWYTPTSNPMSGVGDMIQGTTLGAPAVLSAVATGNVPLSGGVGSPVTWGKVDLTAHITGNLPITNLNSGTGATSSTFWNGSSAWTTPIGLSSKLADFFTDVSNTSTTETDLYTYTTPANTFGTNGDELFFHTTGLFNDATATVNIKLYFGGNLLAQTTALSLTGTGTWSMDAHLIRVSSSVVRTDFAFFTGASATGEVISYVEVTSLTLSGTNIIKVTGTAPGGTGGTGDITAKFGKIIKNPAAGN